MTGVILLSDATSPEIPENSSAKEIVLVEKDKYSHLSLPSPTSPTSPGGSSKFSVSPVPEKKSFQVRRRSVIKPPSETVVTRAWLENAICK